MVSRHSTAAGPTPVREMRRSLKLTQAELADQVGVSRQTIISLERGDYAPSVHLAIRVARALGGTVEELFAPEGEQQ